MEIRIDEAFATGDFAELAYAYAPVGLVITENRVIRDCNAAFAEMFEYAPEDLRNQVFAMLYPTDEEFVNIRDRGVQQLRETNTYWDERVMRKKSGTLFWCRVRGHSFTPDAPLARAVWSFADLSLTRPYLPLTRREREIISYLADGLTSKEIANQLELSYRTVEVYRAKLLKKFGVSNSNGLFQSLGGIGSDHVVSRSGEGS
ncbi:MAG: LuxR C-terminal-related transcriptional regulator [Pseudomonadota bacterium]|uniref:PAS domain S-box-containing protein n=1 Tax=Pseudooceanicola nitratireducens TaxID=517719 RepID=A0A1I1Q741_9RHOB|nr:helix-turn-helix transcriptional regulator [Pseudooceanicola nitratireducens]MEC9102333.1 LuxR C-terminal-related transcriptional regulator [Pseudomonadota bacterium]SEJ72425.1 PAS domain S-box-containing protein [Pseudooceanicola nitratireducens]SFD17817.1 PAS domain S-box-containing protein [Pseudooceanicola nitratireducens]